VSEATSTANGSVVIDCDIKKLYYGNFLAVRDTHLPIQKGEITAFIGPSGCGKSTVLRCLNRMNDLIPVFRFEGHVHFRDQDIYAKSVDPVAVRRHIGMVFQQPNPFAMSVRKNVAFGLRLNKFKGDYDEKVEKALRGAALWDEVKDKLKPAGSPSRAASSSASASPAPSRPSRTSCSWTSRAPRSTPSRRAASRSS
jgi:phosphate transport system ATP-binding protein